MLDAIIRIALRYRVLTVVVALVILLYGSLICQSIPVDVFPNLDRPRVTIFTEASGLAPEEVETLVTVPLESVLSGASGVQTVRSSSGVGVSVIWVEFEWGSDVYVNRQIVVEKIAMARERLPEGIRPQLAASSSIMGQIMHVGVESARGETSPVELRTIADWVVRQRLLTVPGVAQVVTIGGGVKQFQVLVDPDLMLQFGVSLNDVKQAVQASNSNATGGYLENGGSELLVRSLGRIKTIADLKAVVVKAIEGRPVVLGQVARVVEGAQSKRGDAAINGKPAVLLVISKQPGEDTRRLTDDVLSVLESIESSLTGDVRIIPDLYQQKTFIDLSVLNVFEALRDGAVLVVIVLFLFLLNVRATFITLTAIPLSIMITVIVFHVLGMSINTMTLGGLAVAVGELVDDAIVDVENIFRRLRQNNQESSPRPILRVVYEASREVRNSVVFSTVLVVLVFVPLFALGGIEGRLFMPLGLAYIISITASLIVSLTVTPVLSYWLLPVSYGSQKQRKSFLLRFAQFSAGLANRISLRYPVLVLVVVFGCCGVSLVAVFGLGKDFLPPFNEGSVQVNVLLPAGTSLATSNTIGVMVDERIEAVDGVESFSRRTGRGEMDEHTEGVNVSEIIITLNPNMTRSREQILEDIRKTLRDVPGIVSSVEQPLAHLISHMLSGVKAQLGIKLYGDNLLSLRKTAEQIKEAIADVPGVTDLLVEQQVEIPQLQIQIKREKLVQYGLTVKSVNEFIQTAMHGRTVSQVVDGQRVFDLIVRMDDPYRVDVEKLGDLSINLPTGGRVPLDAVAVIREGSGPNTISRENVKRRIVIQCNTVGRDLDGVVREVQQRLAPIEAALPPRSFVEYGGQFESQRQAARTISMLSIISLSGMFFVLYTLFRSVNLSLQVLASLPMAAIGAVGALYLTNQSLTIASMVGFISLCGIASRNGILLIAHYLHLVQYEGEGFTRGMIERAGKERVAPMLMTALTAGIALVPLVLAAGEPGKEILYPIATVILGGLISSTVLDFFVHPALFWCFGMRDAEKAIEKAEADVLAARAH